jgi:hypothetical protein
MMIVVVFNPAFGLGGALSLACLDPLWCLNKFFLNGSHEDIFDELNSCAVILLF